MPKYHRNRMALETRGSLLKKITIKNLTGRIDQIECCASSKCPEKYITFCLELSTLPRAAVKFSKICKYPDGN